MERWIFITVTLIGLSVFSGCSTPPQSNPPRYGADLVITQTADRTSVEEGALITFTITVTNLGPNAASGIVFGSNPPVALEYVSFSCGAASVTNHGFCELDHLPSGKSVISHIIARSIGNSTETVSLSSKAFIAEYIAFDPNRNNNSTSVSVQIVPKTIGLTH